MTPEDITRNLYTWLMQASRIDGLPMGTRPASWDELRGRDPELASKWQLGVDLFLVTIAAKLDDDPHLNFIATTLLAPTIAPDDEPGSEPPPVRPDD
jgi:hypothetical protein